MCTLCVGRVGTIHNLISGWHLSILKLHTPKSFMILQLFIFIFLMTARIGSEALSIVL
jgi:hypothetical protein